ncbi:hypothetical protein EN829_001145 [Mesorhizobium sp. M00.F.Ca.ET.186.01.1.1]|nr:hypothetical protein EN848_09745 [bacterium M00.F.Ca.ET.205.01.1.1]TGU55761.1 hypothetical protein EN795_03280 [bacterium M00.F.Ca.ET.152.01.1.1]TGV39965.1 hypothetical protein EN829_001145 [Mesorhizobium sp. M00.F.Ca.ET.186.01.1.1]TGZ44947.1 hypothetical protein EN805_01140 [bacterium M00.F.Ca.ET.162.01.1.1]
MKTRNKAEKAEKLAAEIRRQLGSEATTRVLRTLPAFRVDKDIPNRFRDQLDRLDGMETNIGGGRRR